jgi:hypothetical protein
MGNGVRRGGEDTVTVHDVAIVAEDALGLLLCRRGSLVFHLPRYHLCNSTFAVRAGREADLVLPRWFAENVGLVTRA